MMDKSIVDTFEINALLNVKYDELQDDVELDESPNEEA